jgi:hypothetical protein
VSFINSRIRKLEETIRGGSACPECGLSSGDAEARRIVTTHEGEDEGRLEEALAEVCEECGRPEVIHIRMVYDR